MTPPSSSRRGIVLPILSLLLLLLAGSAAAETTLKDLDAARALWDSSGLTNYTFRYAVSCECTSATSRPKTVHVRDGTVTLVAFADAAEGEEDEKVPSSVADFIPTVEELFDRIGSAIEEGAAAEVTVEFDAELGHPISIYIDYYAAMADDEFIAVLSEMVPTNKDDSGDAEPDGAAAALLDQAQALWDSSGVEDYQYRFRRSCFCVPEATQPMIVQVRGGDSVESVAYADDADVDVLVDVDGAVPQEIASRVPTVDALFGTVRSAIEDRDAAVVNVAYDGTYGYPVEIYIDYDEMVADEEVHISTGNLTPIEAESIESNGTSVPTSSPTHLPTSEPTDAPTSAPTPVPSSDPTNTATNSPTPMPTTGVTESTGTPTIMPTTGKTIGSPTASPTVAPTVLDESGSPTDSPDQTNADTLSSAGHLLSATATMGGLVHIGFVLCLVWI